MKKFLMVILPVVLGMVGCASNPTNIDKKSQNIIAFTNMHPKQYKLNDVNIRLESSVQKEGFLTKDNIQQTYVDELNKQLERQHKNISNLSTGFALVDIGLIHKRVFMGEGLKFIGGDKLVGGYADTVFTYNVKVTYNGEVVQTFQRKQQIASKGGMIGNFKKIARDLSSTGTPQNEIEDIEKAVMTIVNDLQP
ncbi:MULTISPECIES: putative periplasmic lipoprotein [Acinetobacter]|uniref:Lipoprotein n=2 Tax=Acinetobacter TaxID=469 RepID=N9C1W2_9GAMM|nr:MULTISPECIES: hypothetical protein [Acinetobacter]ENV79842.1 hypothetical protein F942_01574 [Acinetobacter ursingii ANC 3649]MEC6126914.1 hypothetical protein [Acinetobacter ursingii]QXZ23018.1 hypothetical protein I6L31_15285 [Acinetobacter septicus]